MKKILLLLLITCISAISANAVPPASVQRLGSFIRVWGFLKYYHPAMGTGRIDADDLFLKYLGQVTTAPDKKAFSQQLRSMMADLGAPSGKQPQDDTVSLFKANENSGWISTDDLLSADIKAQLLELRKRGYNDSLHRYLPATFYGTEIPAEKKYDSIQYPNIPYQLLALGRYWNAIEYLFAYKYLIEKDWYSVLLEQIPFFAGSMAQEVFEKHLLQVNAAIDDTHGGILQVKQVAKVYGPYYPPFAFRFAGDSLVVTRCLDSLSCLRQDILPGDIIIAIKNRTVAQSAHDYNEYVSASNEAKKRDLFSSARLLLPLRGFDSVVAIRFIRKGKLMSRKLVLAKPDAAFGKSLNRLYQWQTGNGTTTRNDFVLRTIDKGIAWVDAANLSSLYNRSADDLSTDSVLQQMRMHQKAILIDLRCYATQAVIYNKLLPALGWRLKPFAVLQAHYQRFPGTYYTKDIFSSVGEQPLQPAYTGKVIVLVNEQTQSQSELITMILQASGPVIVVGAQTAGCDGDLVNMPLPGGYQTSFSGRHVSYPDGTASQQLGIQRNVPIHYTTSAIASGRDQILEAALALIRL